jgi:hypothetical protein
VGGFFSCLSNEFSAHISANVFLSMGIPKDKQISGFEYKK